MGVPQPSPRSFIQSSKCSFVRSNYWYSVLTSEQEKQQHHDERVAEVKECAGAAHDAKLGVEEVHGVEEEVERRAGARQERPPPPMVVLASKATLVIRKARCVGRCQCSHKPQRRGGNNRAGLQSRPRSAPRCSTPGTGSRTCSRSDATCGDIQTRWECYIREAGHTARTPGNAIRWIHQPMSSSNHPPIQRFSTHLPPPHVHSFINSSIHPSAFQWLVYSFTQQFPCSIIRLHLKQPSVHLWRLFIHSFIHSFVHSLSHSLIHAFTCSFVLLSIASFIDFCVSVICQHALTRCCLKWRKAGWRCSQMAGLHPWWFQAKVWCKCSKRTRQDQMLKKCLGMYCYPQ